MSRFTAFALSTLATALLCSTALVAQKSISPPQIVDTISDDQLITLQGNVHPSANVRNDLGRVNPDLPLSDLILVLKRSPERQAAFDTFVESQYDSSSPEYHRWLEPQEVGALFGPSMSDIAAISNWLRGHGLSVDEVSQDRLTIRFSGTAARVESTFHTEIHNFMVKGEKHIGNMSNPQIPMALEPAVVGVKALHNFLPRPLSRLGERVNLNHDTGKWQRPVSEACDARGVTGRAFNSPHTEFGIAWTVSSGGCDPTYTTYSVEDFAPYDLATMYNILPLWNQASPVDGTGQAIAIAGTSKINLADVVSFRSLFGLPAGTAPQMIVANGTDPGQCTGSTGPCTVSDQIENSLDVEWSGAIAKGAKVVLVVSGATTPSTDTVYSSASYVVQHNTAKILNVSYGLCELGLGTAGNASYNNLWQTAASQGIAVFVASGDSGSAGCDEGLNTSTPYMAQHGLSVNGLASTPFNSAVGGTDVYWGTSAAPYWGTTNDPTNGSNLLGYIPEIPWNDSCTNPIIAPILEQSLGVGDAESACSGVSSSSLSWFVNSWGGGGGKSACTTSDGSTLASCAGGYAKPNWQANVSGIPPDGKRDMPDVSFVASNGFLGSHYLICVSANGTCINSTTFSADPSAQEVGGTSASSTVMAGVMALINQKAGAPQGNPNAELYKLASLQNYGHCAAESGSTSNSCYFNDIDTGTISMPCAIGSPDCTLHNPADSLGLLSGFDAATGFDLATGLGSLNVANVVNAWPQASTATPTVTVSPASSTIATSKSLSVTVTVSGGAGNPTPTGSVTVTSGDYGSAATTLAGGSATINIPAGSLTAGTDTLTANYQPDTASSSTYNSATGSNTVTVTNASFTVSGAPVTLSAGTTTANTSIITITPTDGFTGNVTLSAAITAKPGGAQYLPNLSFGSTSPVNIADTAAGTATLTISTTAPTTAALSNLGVPWYMTSGATLACLLLLGIPKRRRSWRNLLGMLMLLAALTSGMLACGGGGGNSGGGGNNTGHPGTTAGTYTITVTGTSGTTTATGTVTLTVQ